MAKQRATQPITLSVNGAAGRMGKAVLRLAAADPAFRVVEALEYAGSANIGLSAAEGIEITGKHGSANVMIDFSLPAGFQVRLDECIRHKTAFVSGTTGLSKQDFAALNKASKAIPVLHAPNFSVGVNVLCRLVAEAARVLDGYDIEIVEMHHNQKKDSPSGTADRLLRVVTETLKRDHEKDARHGRVGDVGARTPREIGVHALRGGDVVGDHTVIFATHGERVELTHKASSRDTFAAGALRAAKFVAGRKPGVYTIDQVLFGR